METRATSVIPPARYTCVAKVLHWLLVALVFGQIAFGWFLRTVERGTPDRSLYVNLHKSTGITIGLVILIRLYWRLTHAPPPMPATMAAWERLGARASHVALYACMVIMPVAGYLASNFSKYGIRYFYVVALPPWGIDDKQIYAAFNATHVVTSYVFVALIVIHAAAALTHLLRRDGVFERMWPGSLRKAP
jgi:cytochrome b561